MVRGGHSGWGSTSSDAPSTSANRGSTPIGFTSSTTPVVPTIGMFTREEDLPQAQAVWESTAKTNFKKSMWEARDKAAKITGSQDPMTWMDYDPHHKLERAATFCKLFDWTYKRKVTNDYVSESARTIVTYDRTMADRYAEGSPLPDMDPEA
ncbi:hypothetical protein Taro_055931 [Colocasia esculenta]|uniref:Uncharacterized protein n=1 Tax=Colocasia esculenta TaxID=4460 RepID=A0A843XUU5_COLES|nr:hypothetical protein [Colocasia esculenta]